MRATTSLAFLAAMLMATAARAEDIPVKIGVLTDMSSLYADDRRSGLGGGGEIGGGGFQSGRARHEGRGRQRRSSEQARHRRQHRAAMVRRRPCRCDRRRAEFRRRARGQRGGARKEQSVPRLRRRDVRSDRAEMLAQYRALDLRHLDAGQRHRQARWCKPAATPGSSSPPIMPSAMRSSATPRRWCRPMAARCSAASACRSTTRIFRRSCCKRRQSKAKIIGLANAGGDTDQFDQARRRIRHRGRRPALCRVCWSSSPTSRRLG